MSTQTIDLVDLQALIENDAQLLEVLPEAEYKWGHLPGAINIPLKKLTTGSTRMLSNDRPLVVYCWDAL